MGSPQDAALRYRLSGIRAVIQSFETDLAAASPVARPDIELLIRFFEDAEQNAKNEIELHVLTHGGIDAQKEACSDPERYITNAPKPPSSLPSSLFDRTPPGGPRPTREEMVASKRAKLESELRKAEARSSELKKTIADWYLQALPEWDRVTANAKTRWTKNQRLVIEQYGALKLQYEQMLGATDGAGKRGGGRKPKHPEFGELAGRLWQKEQERTGTVKSEGLKRIAKQLEASGFMKPADYLEGKAAKNLNAHNRQFGASEAIKVMTWTVLVEKEDKDQIRAMRRVLSRCARALSANDFRTKKR